MLATSLIELPDDLLEAVAGRLEWQDARTIRLTCKILNEISHRRGVWHQILLRTVPRPFFLRKPLEECASEDLERTIIKWEAPFIIRESTSWTHTPLSSSCLGNQELSGSYLLPGGRWILVFLDDGSVWYYDHDAGASDLSPRPLLPAPYPSEHSSEYGLKSVSHSVDYSATISLGIHHLTQFNIAILTSSKTAGGERVDSARVSQVEVVFEALNDSNGKRRSRATGLRFVRHLSTFPAFGVYKTSDIQCLSLRGSTLAYTSRVGSSKGISIVDWTCEGEGSNDQVGRWYIPSYDVLGPMLYLLPYDRLLILNWKSSMVELYNWRSDCPRSSAALSNDLDKVTPFWSHHLDSGIYPDDVQNILIAGDEIRVPISSTEMYGLTISLDPESELQPKLEMLSVIARSFFSRTMPNYHRSIIVEYRECKVYSFQYSWAAEDTNSAKKRRGYQWVSCTGSQMSGDLLFDEYTNTAILVVPVGRRDDPARSFTIRLLPLL